MFTPTSSGAPPIRMARTSVSRQRGVTLVVSLVFLLLLTILGITAINTSTLQEKMAGNQRDQDMALQAAESGLRGGEARLVSLWASSGTLPASTSTCSGGNICAQGTTLVLDDSWWNANSTEYGAAGSKEIIHAVSDPRFVIEQDQSVRLSLPTCKYSTCPTDQYYRISSRAAGTTATSQVILEEMFRVRH